MMLRYSGDKFLKKDRFPMFWCSGCGNGILLGCIVRAMEESCFTRENTVVVTGIGCWGKADDYLTTHSFHGTHGRAIPIATGVKLANPDLNVIALVGDGDGLTIGGNHIIHAARRNMDLTVIMSNNTNYGMTGGQYSGTTPYSSLTSTSRYGHVEDAFDAARLIAAAGAGYVAKETVASPVRLQKYITKALRDKSGFRFIEAVNICPTHYGKNNRMGKGPDMIGRLKEASIVKKRAEGMGDEALKGKIVVGEYADTVVDGYIKRYKEVQKRAAKA